MNFNVDSLIEKCRDYENKGNRTGGFPKTTWLPEGKHKGRFIVDSTGEVFTTYYAYGFGNKGLRDPRGLDPKELPPGFVDELATVTKQLKDEGKFKYAASEIFLVPFYLEDTDSRGERWEPGNLYYVIGNKKFSQSLIKFLGSIAKESPDTIQTLLDPNKSAPLIDIQFTKGTSGGCNIGVAFPQRMGDPIDLTKHVYVSLEEAYIPKGFDQSKYNNLLAEAKQALAELPREGQAQPTAQSEIVAQPTQQAATQTATVTQEQPQSTQTDEDNPWNKFRQQTQG